MPHVEHMQKPLWRRLRATHAAVRGRIGSTPHDATMRKSRQGFGGSWLPDSGRWPGWREVGGEVGGWVGDYLSTGARMVNWRWR